MSLRLHGFDEPNGHPAKVGLGLVFDFDEEPFVGLLTILNPIPSDGVGSAQGASHAADYAGNRVAVAAETRPLYDAPVWIYGTVPKPERRALVLRQGPVKRLAGLVAREARSIPW